MTLTIDLTPETEARLKAEAKRRGLNQTDMARQLIEESLNVTTGADALAFWKQKEVLGTFADRQESSENLARKLRQEAESRGWSAE